MPFPFWELSADGPFPFLEPSAYGFSDLTGMLLNAVNSEGMINVEAKVALRAGSSKLSLDVYERHYQGIMRRASHA